jgi:ataxia telangiectasia mutated family protein
MVILLKTGLVRYVDIADSVDTMLGSVDLHGPIEFTESAVELWRLIISSKARHNPGQIYDTSERVLRWLFTRWKPCK